MLKILVVDDDESVRNLLQDALAIDYAVGTSATRGEAKNRLKTDTYDLVFLDMILNGRESSDLLYWIKKQKLHCDVIIITGHDKFFNKFKGEYDKVADDILLKPFDIKDAINIAARALDKKLESFDG